MELFLNYDPEKTCVMSDYVKSMSDLTLMKLISRGHPDALKELLDRHMEAVALTAYRILCNHDESVAVVKDVFAGLWRKTFDYDYSLEIRNLLVMRAAEAARKRLVRNRLLSIFGLCRSDEEVKSWEGDTWQVFCRASHEMSPRQRVVYTLRELDSLSENISERMTGLSRSRISHLLDEAKKQIKSELVKYGRMMDYKPYLAFLRNVRDGMTNYDALEQEILYLCAK